MTTTETVESRARRLVQNEVMLCMSSLVSTLATGAHIIDHRNASDLASLSELAYELCYPLNDYEEAAIQAGWSETSTAPDQHVFTDSTDGQTWCASSWQELCEDHDIEPLEREVYEHWAVSDYLGDKLIAHGEKVEKDFNGLVIWARCTTGQAIYADYVIETIAKDLMAG